MGRKFVGYEFTCGYQAEMEEVDEPEVDPLEIFAGRGSAIRVNRYAEAAALERVQEVSGIIRLINRDRSGDLILFDTTSMPGQYTWKKD